MLRLRGRDLSEWAVTILLTAGTLVVAKRLVTLIPEPVMLCLAFLAPAALVARCLACGLLSLTAVLLFGHLHIGWNTFGLLAFSAVGVAFTALVMALSMSDAAKLAEARKGLTLISARSQAYIKALECAGVPVLVLDRQGAWLSANVSAVHAVGMPEQVELLGRTHSELDQRAAEALMYSASRASWLAWMERFRASLQDTPWEPPNSYSHPITLFDRGGVRTSYTLHALPGEDGETILVACRHP